MKKALMALITAGTLALGLSGCALQTNGLATNFSFDCPSFNYMKVQVDPSGMARYYYNGFCSLDGGPQDFFTVEADYMPTHTGAPGSAFERITDTTQGANAFASFWLKCSGVDPWYTGTQCAVDNHAGPLADGIMQLSPAFPISSSVLTPAQRQQLKTAKDYWKTQLCPPQDMFTVIPTPGGNASHVHDVLLQVDPGAEWCQMSHVYDLEWQRNSAPAGYQPNWINETVLARVDESQQPGGINVWQAAFANGGAGAWRVRARVANESAAPWSAWSSFRIP
jgi:hypothetical protein